MKRKIGILLFICSIIFLLIGIDFNLTGNFIREYFQSQFRLMHLIGIFLFINSIVILVSKKGLEAIVVPTGGIITENIERADEAGKNYDKDKNQYYVISGELEDKTLKNSGRTDIYRELRKYGIKPSQMIVEGKSSDSLENVMYTLKRLKKDTKEISFVSYPLHLKKFKYIMSKAKEECLAPKNLKVKYLPTKQSAKEFIYGILALMKEKYRLRKGINHAMGHKTGKLGNFVKKLVS